MERTERIPFVELSDCHGDLLQLATYAGSKSSRHVVPGLVAIANSPAANIAVYAVPA
jgi:hypothetical protein